MAKSSKYAVSSNEAKITTINRIFVEIKLSPCSLSHMDGPVATRYRYASIAKSIIQITSMISP
jgi:hypothetical protein